MEPNEYLLKLFEFAKDMESLNLFSEAARLSKTEFRLVREIVLENKQGKDIISSELARRLGVTRSAVSQIVTKLETQDVVKRVAAPNDRKIAYVRLSDRCMGIYNDQCQQANRLIARVVEEFGEKKMTQLFNLYDGFHESLEKVRSEEKNQDQ